MIVMLSLFFGACVLAWVGLLLDWDRRYRQPNLSPQAPGLRSARTRV